MQDTKKEDAKPEKEMNIGYTGGYHNDSEQGLDKRGTVTIKRGAGAAVQRKEKKRLPAGYVQRKAVGQSAEYFHGHAGCIGWSM